MIFLLKDESGNYKIGTSDNSLIILGERPGDERLASRIHQHLKNFLSKLDLDIDKDYIESELIKRFYKYVSIQLDESNELIFEMSAEEAENFLSSNPLFYDYICSRVKK